MTKSKADQQSLSRSGVFKGDVDSRVQSFTQSLATDERLFRHDIAGSAAHANMLASIGVLADEENSLIQAGLREILAEYDRGDFTLRPELEDVHMNIEAALIERLEKSGHGDVGRKLHTGRSRNDQVATDARLWARASIDQILEALHEIQTALVSRCVRDEGTVLPAYTHLQRAQPVLAAHYYLAYCEKFERDRQRLLDCRRRVNVCPLGTAALAGTSIPIDREMTAKALDFEAVIANSLDSSSDRDFLVEFTFCLSMIACHLSGWAEEWIIWSSVEFQFVRIPQQFCTGSSIMPQKINPDVLELIRGKSARVIGDLHTLLTLIRSLPLAYNRDLQEDKPPAFDALDTVLACLELAAPIIADAELQTKQIAGRLESGFLDATTFMEYLIKRGVPQRTAHHVVGTVVGIAMDRGIALSELSLEELQDVCGEVDASVHSMLGTQNAVEAFCSYGSTAPSEVAKQVAAWQSRIQDRSADE